MTGLLPWNLLDRYFSGEASPEERSRVEAWVAGDESRRRYLASLREIWTVAGDGAPAVDTDAAWARMRRRMDPSGADRDTGLSAPASVGRVRPRRPAPRRSRAVTAVVAVLLLGGLGLLARWGGAAAGGEATRMRTLATETGQRSVLRFPDGTRVVLGPESRIRVPAGYGSPLRTVYLDAGEAFFEVRHDAERPFRVLAGDVVAEDLGTEFVVRRGAEAEVQVVVSSGEVSLHAGERRSPVLLQPGHLGRTDAAGRVAVDSTANLETHLAWLTGRLVFDQAPLRQVLSDLERWYGVRFRLADPALGAVPITASFPDQSLEAVLEVLAAALDVRIRRTGDTVLLFSPEVL